MARVGSAFASILSRNRPGGAGAARMPEVTRPRKEEARMNWVAEDHCRTFHRSSIRVFWARVMMPATELREAFERWVMYSSRPAHLQG